jgi:hypothetical protein
LRCERMKQPCQQFPLGLIGHYNRDDARHKELRWVRYSRLSKHATPSASDWIWLCR